MNCWLAFGVGFFLGLVCTILLLGLFQIIEKERKSPYWRQAKRKALNEIGCLIIIAFAVGLALYIV